MIEVLQIMPHRLIITTHPLHDGYHTATINIWSEDYEAYQICTGIRAEVPEQAAYELATSIKKIWDGIIIDNVKVLDCDGEIVRDFTLTFLVETYKMLTQPKTIQFISEDEDQFDFELDFDEDT